MTNKTDPNCPQRWVRVAEVADVPEGEMLPVTIEGKKLALYHLEEGGFCATANVCTHEFALLTDGWFEGGEIECPLHAGRFDVRTGKGLCAPIEKDLPVYAVEVREDEIFVALPESAT
ncbi:MAG TPA: non-heme iron oxygenase ferredoxin subunit [Devosiaceae bacterium]|jgi:nitrite reductase/ring-hydroxylating ferredoxin subunit|nr:non-heme iron oxygenase ferredoxin subunit [Devosiaceae bacterium]